MNCNLTHTGAKEGSLNTTEILFGLMERDVNHFWPVTSGLKLSYLLNLGMVCIKSCGRQHFFFCFIAGG